MVAPAPHQKQGREALMRTKDQVPERPHEPDFTPRLWLLNGGYGLVQRPHPLPYRIR